MKLEEIDVGTGQFLLLFYYWMIIIWVCVESRTILNKMWNDCEKSENFENMIEKFAHLCYAYDKLFMIAKKWM